MSEFKLYHETEESKIRRTCGKILKVLHEMRQEQSRKNLTECDEEVFYTAAAGEADIARYCRKLANGRWLCTQKIR